MAFAVSQNQEKMNDWERTLFILAEMLHMPVYKLREEMPLSEMLGWIRYIKSKGEEKPLDVTELSEDQLKEMFG